MAKVWSENDGTPAAGVNEVSRISGGSFFKGSINTPGDIRIDGSFEGRLIAGGRVVVGEKAVISGDIIAGDVDLWGKMTGGLFVRGTLSLKDGCVIKGDLHVRKLAVELGSVYDGKCDMLSEENFDDVVASVTGSENAAGTPKPVSGGTIIK